jgi:hypothetical protein
VAGILLSGGGETMIAMCFDLSSTCIGVTFAQLKDEKLHYLKTMPIIPKRPSAKELGYTTQEPKKIHFRGNSFPGLLKSGEFEISKEEAGRRMADFKNFSHRSLLKNIGEQCGYYLDSIKPNVIAIERNKSFNGVLTTKLLAEIAGGIYFYCGAKKIPLYDYDEKTVRAKIRRDITKFNLLKQGTDQMAVDTKWEIYCRLHAYFESHYPSLVDFSNMTMDESDSLAVFYHLFTTELRKKEMTLGH